MAMVAVCQQQLLLSRGPPAGPSTALTLSRLTCSLLLFYGAVGVLTLAASRSVRQSKAGERRGTILSLMWNNLCLLFLAFCVVGQRIPELPGPQHDIDPALR